MYGAAFRSQQRVFRVTVVLILGYRILNRLIGIVVFQLQCHDGQTIQRNHHINAVAVFLAVDQDHHQVVQEWEDMEEEDQEWVDQAWVVQEWEAQVWVDMEEEDQEWEDMVDIEDINQEIKLKLKK